MPKPKKSTHPTLEKFVEIAKLGVNTTLVPSRGDDFDEHKGALHWHFVLTADSKVIHVGHYTKGFAHLERWAQQNRTLCRMARLEQFIDPLPLGRRWDHDAPAVKQFKERFGNRIAPDVTEILASLVMDASSADQPFADWAGDLGYDDDSIKARGIWEECQKIYYALRKVFKPGEFDALTDLAHEL